MSVKWKSWEVGSSMIEMMVALFILAVGLLGILAMQAGGIKSNQRAQFSTEAQILGSDMVDRIRAFNDIDTTADDAAYDGIDTAALIPADPGCATTGCSKSDNGGDQKTYDEWEWGTQLARRLPNGKGRVTHSAATGKYLVEVFWDNEMTGATGMGCSGNAAVDMACFRIEVKL